MNTRLYSPRLFFLILLILFPLTPESSWAANHYVRAGSTGAGNGSDWINACTDFTGACAVANLVRGDTYYVATGVYAARLFNTPESGNLTITIKGATAADHGTATGWVSSYGVDASQAQFQFDSVNRWSIYLGTSYITFDGNTGGGSSIASYGFKLQQPATCTTPQEQYLFVGKVSSSQTTTDVTVKHVAAPACGAAYDVPQLPFVFGCSQCYVTNSTFAYLYASGGNKAFQITNVANSTLEYSWSQNQWSTSGHHGETISINNCHINDSTYCSAACPQGQCAYNGTLRYNTFRNCTGTACIAALDPGYPASINAWKIYGNIFYDGQAGNGVIATGTSATHYIKDTLIYNNTFVNIASGNIVWQCGATTSCASTSGNVFMNNLLYNSGAGLNEGPSGGAITHDYNAWISSIGTPPSEQNGQIGSLNPFMDYSGGNYHLVDGTSLFRGITLSNPYTMDMDLKVRGGDGKWDIGAYEFTGGADKTPPGSPQNVRVF